MSHDPYHLTQAGQARLAALILEAQGQPFEYPAHSGRSWLRYAWRRLRVARQAYRMQAQTRHANRPRSVSITIEIKYW